MKALEEKLLDLELRFSQQEELVDSLNTQVYRQQNKIVELESLCQAFAKRLQEVALSAQQKVSVVDEKPPHY